MCTPEFQWPVGLGQQEHTAQDAQKGQISQPAQPWRAETRLVPSKAAAPQLTLVSRFTLLWNEARTRLADFFSILLKRMALKSGPALTPGNLTLTPIASFNEWRSGFPHSSPSSHHV